MSQGVASQDHGTRIARLEGRMDRIEDTLSRLREFVPVVAAFMAGAWSAWMVTRHA